MMIWVGLRCGASGWGCGVGAFWGGYRYKYRVIWENVVRSSNLFVTSCQKKNFEHVVKKDVIFEIGDLPEASTTH